MHGPALESRPRSRLDDRPTTTCDDDCRRSPRPPRLPALRRAARRERRRLALRGLLASTSRCVAGSPWLFAEPNAALGEWRGRLHFSLQRLERERQQLAARTDERGRCGRHATPTRDSRARHARSRRAPARVARAARARAAHRRATRPISRCARACRRIKASRPTTRTSIATGAGATPRTKRRSTRSQRCSATPRPAACSCSAPAPAGSPTTCTNARPPS